MAFVPYVPAERRLPELTVRAVILGVILSVLLGAANAYLGLRIGLTVSASIPAAVVSMAILRALRNHSILENNAVQTAASAGESLAAGIIFTVPALVMMGHWTEVHYLETTLMALVGGLLGVLFTVPLRRALIVETDLTFPEGVATSEVLKAGEADRGTGVGALLVGVTVGLAYKFMEAGLHLWRSTILAATRFRENGVVAFGSDLSPALVAVGYIVGLRIAVLVFAGGVIGWLVGIPVYSALAGDAGSLIASTQADILEKQGRAATVADLSFAFWSERIRYMGVGAMLVGGLWSLVMLRRPLGQALRKAFVATPTEPSKVPRTEQEFGIRATFFVVAGMSVPIGLLYFYASGSASVAILMSLLMVIMGFLFSAVAAYMAGLVGSSNNPISGVTILTVLASALTLRYVLGVDTGDGPAVTILVATIIAGACAIAGDNMQDLKAGRLLGATPRRQQVMQIVGATALALAIAPVLNILHEAYTFGSGELTAAQATLMQAVAQSIFEGGLPQTMIAIGAAIALLLVVVDEVLERTGSTFRTPVMPVAVGIYLPVGLTTPIFLGGLIAWTAHRAYRRRQRNARGALQAMWDARRERGVRDGTLLASGLIAGEAFVGIGVGTVIVLAGGNVMALSDGGATWPGLLAFAYVLFLVWYVANRARIVEPPHGA